MAQHLTEAQKRAKKKYRKKVKSITIEFYPTEMLLIEQIEKNGRILYKTRIHINGNYTIGTYTSENEAAIAYNRAIDLLAEQLPDFKNYTRNYIEGLSHIEYASIYNTVKISRRFRRYIEQLGLTY